VLCLIGSHILPADWGVLYFASGLFLSHRDFGSHSMTSRLLVSLHGHLRSCLPCCQHAPAVVAVLVTHEPGEWFAATRVSLHTQDYSALSALVIDAASTDGSALRDRAGAILAARFPCCAGRLEKNGGSGLAANEALRSVQGTSFSLFWIVLSVASLGLFPVRTTLFFKPELYFSSSGLALEISQNVRQFTMCCCLL
jgi:hypothetical protein